jgi:hypothetical protein
MGIGISYLPFVPRMPENGLETCYRAFIDYALSCAAYALINLRLGLDRIEKRIILSISEVD